VLVKQSNEKFQVLEAKKVEEKKVEVKKVEEASAP